MESEDVQKSDEINLCNRGLTATIAVIPTIGVIFVSFDKEFRQVSDNIAHHSTEIDWAANAANIEELKRVRGSEEATRQGMLSSCVIFSYSV
jgi:hypothetical protein